jgi:hypothetical protein
LDKRFIICFFVFFTIIGCTTLKIKDKETYSKVLYKNLVKKSSKINDAYITGLFKISGIEEIPSIFMEFQLSCVFPEKQVTFRIRVLNNNLIDIFINKNDVYIINNIEKNYYKTDIEKIDFSKVTGINFNPLDVSYFFLGVIPNNDKMELINFISEKNDNILEISDSNCKYTINLNQKELITKVKVKNQYFDPLILESIKYKDNNMTGLTVPNMFVFSSEDKKTKISFIINKAKINQSVKSIINVNDIIAGYKSTNNPEDIKINAEKFKNQIKNN